MDGLNLALEHLLSPAGLGLVLLGTALGITVGAVPGLTGAMLIALTLPLTFTMVPEHAMILLVGMYVGSVSGGLITATLLRMPGTPASIMTTLDGYPMAQAGQPGRALGLGISASLVGGLIAGVFLILLARPMAVLSTRFGPFEFFSLVMMALVLITSVGGNSLTRSLLSGFLGILASMPGIASATGEARLTFGLTELNDGFKLLPVLIGLFAINQLIADTLTLDTKPRQLNMSRAGLFLSTRDWAAQGVNLLRSSLIGTWIGILPGVGANIGSVSAYAAARHLSQNPEAFGTGCDEGVVASESANNATVGGALIPLVSMGIPGSVIDAILLGALVIHGLNPGPLLFEQNPSIVYTIMGTYVIANFVMAAIMIGLGGLAGPPSRPPPCASAFGDPALLCGGRVRPFEPDLRRVGDVRLRPGGFCDGTIQSPAGPVRDRFRPGPGCRRKNLSAGLMASAGSYAPIVTRPLSAVFFFIAIGLLALPLIRHFRPTPRSEDANDE